MSGSQLRKNIAKNLQIARKRKFKSASAFAEYLGIAYTAYVEYEQGRSSFNVEQAWMFAEALDCSIDELVGHKVIDTVVYSDREQEKLNRYYESMNEKGKSTLIDTARLMSGSDEVRVDHTGEGAEISPEVA